MLVVGCRPQQPFYFKEDGDLSHYVGVATNIDYPDAVVPSLGDVQGAQPPLSLENPEPKEMWDLTLQETMRITLDNSKVMRNLGGVVFGQGGAQGDPTALLSQASIIPSIYDPARTESDPRFGVEGALAAFDAQFTTSVFWERLDTPQNVQRGTIGSLLRPDVNRADTGTFQAQLSKTNATGGTVALTHNIDYELSNASFRQWPSAWSTNIVAQVRQPLLQGAGVQFNRIASPNSIPGFYNGVLIARLRTDTALTEFEGAVRDLVRDTERAYWELYYAYRQLDTAIAGRDSALQTWRQVYAKFVVGGRGGSAQDEAQARQQYYLFRSAVEQALSNLYTTENHLRYIMGLAVTDGRLIRPADEPTTAKVTFDWYEIHAESLTRSVELRQQKWVVKQRELELIAAKNFLLPRLDAVAQYRWLGLGDQLIDPSNPIDPDTQEPNNAFGSLTSGRYQEWQLGLQLNVPIGFRKEMAGVRNAQLNLARDRSVLQEQELELSHQLGNAVRELNDNYTVTGTQFNRRRSAEDEVNAVRAAYEQGVVTLDLLLLAQQRLAEAESAYFRSLVDYNEAIANVHYRKGSLLEYDGVCLAEGPWPAKAYFDATRLARARDASYYLNYGFTRPRVISRGPINQHPHNANFLDESMGLKPGQPEAIPTPAPEPNLVPEPETPSQPQPGTSQQTAKPSATGLQRVSYLQPATSGPSVDSAGWKGTKTPGTTHESVKNPAPADADRTATGWKRVQR
jgi:outer membrane protein TolC